MATSLGTTRVRARGCAWYGFDSRALGTAGSAVEKRRPAGGALGSSEQRRLRGMVTARAAQEKTAHASGLYEQYRPASSARISWPGGKEKEKGPSFRSEAQLLSGSHCGCSRRTGSAGKNPTRLGAPLPATAAAGDGGHRGRAGSGRPLWRRSASGAPAPASRRRGQAQAPVVQGRAGAASARGPDPRHAGNAITCGIVRDAPSASVI